MVLCSVVVLACWWVFCLGGNGFSGWRAKAFLYSGVGWLMLRVEWALQASMPRHQCPGIDASRHQSGHRNIDA